MPFTSRLCMNFQSFVNKKSDKPSKTQVQGTEDVSIKSCVFEPRIDALEQNVTALKLMVKDLQVQLQGYHENDQTERAEIMKTLQEVRTYQTDTPTQINTVKCETPESKESNKTTIKRPRLTIITQPFEPSAAIPIPKKSKRRVKQKELSPKSISPAWYPISDDLSVSAL